MMSVCVCASCTEWTREMIQRPVKNIVVVVLLRSRRGNWGIFDATNISESKIPKGERKKRKFCYYEIFHRNFLEEKHLKNSICCPKRGRHKERCNATQTVEFIKVHHFTWKNCGCKWKISGDGSLFLLDIFIFNHIARYIFLMFLSFHLLIYVLLHFIFLSSIKWFQNFPYFPWNFLICVWTVFTNLFLFFIFLFKVCVIMIRKKTKKKKVCFMLYALFVLFLSNPEFSEFSFGFWKTLNFLFFIFQLNFEN